MGNVVLYLSVTAISAAEFPVWNFIIHENRVWAGGTRVSVSFGRGYFCWDVLLFFVLGFSLGCFDVFRPGQ